MAHCTPESSRTPARIASLLGLPIAQFTDPDAVSRWDGFAEGLQLLRRIESPEGMRRALEALRAIAAAEPGQDTDKGRT